MEPTDWVHPVDRDPSWRLEGFEVPRDGISHRRDVPNRLPWWSWLVPLVIGLTAVVVLALGSEPADAVEYGDPQHGAALDDGGDRLRVDALVRSEAARWSRARDGSR